MDRAWRQPRPAPSCPAPARRPAPPRPTTPRSRRAPPLVLRQPSSTPPCRSPGDPAEDRSGLCTTFRTFKLDLIRAKDPWLLHGVALGHHGHMERRRSALGRLKERHEWTVVDALRRAGALTRADL